MKWSGGGNCHAIKVSALPSSSSARNNVLIVHTFNCQLSSAGGYAQGTSQGSEYGDYDFKDLFPVYFHVCGCLEFNGSD